MSIVLQKTRGTLVLVGSPLDDFVQHALEATKSVAGTSIVQPPYHITLLSSAELRELAPDQVTNILADTRQVFSAGIGGNPNTGIYFVVIIWAAGQQLRKRLGLPPMQFHIALSSRDDHDMDKGLDSLLPGQFPHAPTPDFLDHLAFTLHVLGQYQKARPYCVDLVRALPDSHRGFIRLADVSLRAGQHKLAMLSYGRASVCTTDWKVKDYCVKKMVECSKETEWGSVFLEPEMSQLPVEIAPILCAPWSLELRSLLSETCMTPSLRLESRQSLYVPAAPKFSQDSAFYKLPRFFRWLIPYHIAIMSTPRTGGDIAALASPHLGIRHVLTLTEETPLHKSWFIGKPITNTFLPIPNFHPPSIEQMDLIIRLVDDDDKLPLLIHCGCGKGRAGTVAACYLAAYGFNKLRRNQTHPEMSANEAITTLRGLRPGSIETPQQETFVSTWCSTIWERQFVFPDLPSEPPPCPLEIEGTLSEENDLFILVGLPGSGKSWLSDALLTRDPKGWTRISQDDSGSRSGCEREIGQAHGRVLLDRCNTAATDRRAWLKLASNWVIAPVCIWFDYDRDLCTSRAQMRAGHPTLPPGSRVRTAVAQMHEVFVRPTLKEGFQAVVIVRSFAAARELVLRLSPPVTIFKFPRTPHLIDLGAATSDDILTDTAALSQQGHVVITEKVDGSNMGFSLSADRSQIIVQNRSHFVNPSTHAQFKKLGLWVDHHREDLYKVLDRDKHFAERYILFGEWMFATHSIPYTRLPDRFIAFDLYDRSTGTWADRMSISGLLTSTTIQLVPIIYEGIMPTDPELRNMVQLRSSFWKGRIEGIYVKVEKKGGVVSRGKVVRADFISGNKHWTRGDLRVNGLASDYAERTGI